MPREKPTLEQARAAFAAAEKALEEARTVRRAAEVAALDAEPEDYEAAARARDEKRELEEQASAARWAARAELIAAEYRAMKAADPLMELRTAVESARHREMQAERRFRHCRLTDTGEALTELREAQAAHRDARGALSRAMTDAARSAS